MEALCGKVGNALMGWHTCIVPQLHISHIHNHGKPQMTDPKHSITGLIAMMDHVIDHLNGSIADWNAGVTERGGQKEVPVDDHKQSLATISN